MYFPEGLENTPFNFSSSQHIIRKNFNFTSSQCFIQKRAIFQTFWRIHSCAKFLSFELETSNFGSSYVFSSPLKWRGRFLPNMTFWTQKWHILGKMHSFFYSIQHPLNGRARFELTAKGNKLSFNLFIVKKRGYFCLDVNNHIRISIDQHNLLCYVRNIYFSNIQYT